MIRNEDRIEPSALSEQAFRPFCELSVRYEQATRRGPMPGAHKGPHAGGEMCDRLGSGKILWRDPCRPRGGAR